MSNEEYFTLDDFIQKYGDLPAIGSIDLDDIVALVDTERARWEEEQAAANTPQKIQLLRQYCMGWDISPIHPMSREDFLYNMRGFENNAAPVSMTLVSRPSLWSWLARLAGRFFR